VHLYAHAKEKMFQLKLKRILFSVASGLLLVNIFVKKLVTKVTG